MLRNILLGSFVLLIAFSFIAFAHPPKSLDVNLDLSDKMLYVMAMHDVQDPTEHFIQKISIELNGKKIIEQTCSAQTDKEKQDLMFTIPEAKAGDKISAKVECIRGGTKTTETVVKSAPPPAPVSTPPPSGK